MWNFEVEALAVAIGWDTGRNGCYVYTKIRTRVSQIEAVYATENFGDGPWRALAQLLFIFLSKTTKYHIFDSYSKVE